MIEAKSGEYLGDIQYFVLN